MRMAAAAAAVAADSVRGTGAALPGAQGYLLSVFERDCESRDASRLF